MFSLKRSCSHALLIILNLSFLVIPVQAQFWHVLPPIGATPNIDVSFSEDGKKVFYLATKDGVGNVWSAVILDKYGGIIAGPKNPPVQITKFTDRGIVRFLHLLNKPQIVFMRATENGKDFHVYRMKDDGSEQPQDLTPGGDGITNVIIGASNNGRYVYYSSNAVHRDKVDVYRYDTQQFTSDLIFPNDKDYQVLAWTRDQNKLLVEDSSARTLVYYNIETTDRTPLGISNGTITNAEYGPPGIKLIPIRDGQLAKSSTSSANDLNEEAKNAILSVDYSPNGKFQIHQEGGKWIVNDVATGTSLSLPDNAHLLTIAPKETLLVYSISSSNGERELYLYDIAKQAQTLLTSVSSH